jgi:excisionase family DNA binding protein
MNKSDSSSDRSQWLDLRALRRYVCVSDRTLREWIHRPVDALPAVRVGTKILVRRSTLDAWLEAHKLEQIDVDIILDEMIASIKAKP